MNLLTASRPVSISLTHSQAHFEALKKAYPGRRLLIVSNTAGASSWDPKLKQAVEVEGATGIPVLSHSVKKPGCGAEIMEYFKKHPETGVTDTSQIAVVGDRLTTDMMLANMMGGWGFWIKDGVIPLEKKSIVRSPPNLLHRAISFSPLITLSVLANGAAPLIVLASQRLRAG